MQIRIASTFSRRQTNSNLRRASLLPAEESVERGYEAPYVALGSGLVTSVVDDTVTIELWATLESIYWYARIIEIGTGVEEYFVMTWVAEEDENTDLVRWQNNGDQHSVENSNAPYTVGTEFHIVLSIVPDNLGGTVDITWYSAPTGAPDLGAARGTIATNTPLSGFNDLDFFLGKSHHDHDHVANASYNDVRIWAGELTDSDREQLHDMGPDADL